MNEGQYRWVLKNRRTYDPIQLFGGQLELAVVRDAARDVRRRNKVEQALARLLPLDLCDAVIVERVADDTVVLGTKDPVLGERLRTQQPGLQRDLAVRVPGIRRVQVRVRD